MLLRDAAGGSDPLAAEARCAGPRGGVDDQWAGAPAERHARSRTVRSDSSSSPDAPSATVSKNSRVCAPRLGHPAQARWRRGAQVRGRPGRTRSVPQRISGPQPARLERPALVDTAVWTWVRDRRFPGLAEWFNTDKTHVVYICCRSMPCAGSQEPRWRRHLLRGFVNS